MDHLNAAYLDTSSGQWSRSLLSSYAFLRRSWQTDWLGLPMAVSYCIDYLKLRTDCVDKEVVTLLEAALAIAEQIENEKGCGRDTPEPSYHNRLHFAESLTTITLQCGLEIHNGAKPDKAWQAALLLIALSHDFRHTGCVNRHVSDIESITVNFLIPLLNSKKLSTIWIDRICETILRSDFSLVKENHARVAGRTFQWDQAWATVLLNEADIMSSASEIFGPMNSHALSLEWQAANFPPFATVATESGRRQFLSSIQFSSYSGQLLSCGILAKN
jgi:hypothetical protein